MTTDQTPEKKRHGFVRRIYDWVLHWADTPWAVPALFLISFAESSFFPIPPDVLLIALCVGDRAKSWSFALWCSIASVLGGLAGYGIGMFFWDAVDQWFLGTVFSQEQFLYAKKFYDDDSFLLVFIGAFTPIPYKVITITAGVCGINLPMFLLASAVGRSARFFLVAGLIRRFGPPIREFLETRFELVTIAGTVLLVGGFVAARYMF